MDTPIDYNDTTGYNPLFFAVHNGNINLLPALVKKYSAIETVQGKTLINVAVARGHEEIVRLLTENDKEGNSPLHVAVKHNQTSVFNRLVKIFNVNQKNCRGETPLYYAAMSGNIEFTKILIENGASVNVRDSKDKTPLYHALKAKKSVELAEVLFKNGAVLSENDCNHWSPLFDAAEDGNLEMVKSLMARGFNQIDRTGFWNSPLSSAVVSDSLEMVKYLMENGLKRDTTITEDSLNLFDACIKQGRTNIFKFLVEIGVKTNDNPFDDSIYQKSLRIWRLLLTCRSKMDSNAFFNETQLHWTVRTNQLEPVKILVNEQADTVRSDSFVCKAAVYIAVENGNEDILKVLLNAGYSTESCFEDTSPVHLAATYEHTRLVEALLKVGADVNSATEEGYTPLHFAAIAAQPVVVKYLLENGAEPLKPFDIYNSPLLLALHMFSSRTEHSSVSPSVFKKLVEVTKMLITKQKKVSYDFLSSATEITVFSDENEQNIDDHDDRAVMCGVNTKLEQFRLDLVRCILNHHRDDEIERNTKLALEFDDKVKQSPELVQMLMEYNDFKSCSDIRNFLGDFSKVDYKCHLLQIDYFKNVNRLLNIEFYEPSDSANEDDKVKNTARLKLMIARLVLLTNSRDSKVTKFCREHKHLDWRKECQQQKAKMQKTKITDHCRVSYYDILTEAVENVAIYVRNESFLKIVESSSAKFPAYTDFIKLRVEKGIRRNDLREECKNLMQNMIKENYKIRFSDPDLDYIFQYFSVLDLRRISEAFS